MTRILVLSNLYPPHDYGGYEQSCADVMRWLAERGHEVRVLTSRHRRPGRSDDPDPGSHSHSHSGSGSDPGPHSDPAGRVVRDLHIYWTDQRLIVPPRRTRARWEWENRRALRRVLREARPEVVSVWNMGAMSMGLLGELVASGIPTVHAVCNDWLVWGPDQDAWMKGLSDRPRTARVISAVSGLPTRLSDIGAEGTFLFVSDWTRRYAESHSRWSFPDASVVYSGIEASEFQAGPVPKEWGWRLLYAGRLDPDKGPLTALETLARLPEEATLEMVGPGSDRQRQDLEKAAAQMDLARRVRFSDLPRREVAKRYRQADVLIFPSRWEEPFGLVPVEAMACGTPVIGTCLGGSAEFLADGLNALCVPREDPDAAAAAVRRLAARPELRARLVANGLSTAAELTTERLAETIEAWLTAAAGGWAAGRPAPRRLPPPLPPPLPLPPLPLPPPPPPSA